MKTNKIITNISDSTKRKVFIIMTLLIYVGVIYAAGGGTHPGTDEGLPTPIDGGLLMALLAGGGLVAMLVKKKKEKKIE
jgi:hypothetical protein